MKERTGLVVYLSGPDGSGKTTLAEEVGKQLLAESRQVSHVWLRFNHYFVKIANALGRMLGWSYHEVYEDGSRLGYHDYWKSPLFSRIFIYLTLFDSWLAFRFKVRKIKPHESEACIVDRFTLDTLVDLIVDTRDKNLPDSWAGKKLLDFIPPNWVCILILVPYKTILERRPSLAHDRELENRISIYRSLARRLDNLHVVENTAPLQETLKKIRHIYSEQHEEKKC